MHPSRAPNVQFSQFIPYACHLWNVKLINIFTSKIKNPVNSDRALGWDTPSKDGKSTAGNYFSDQTYGHLGFTGTSLWIDPKNDIIVIFLTNRVHPTRNKDGINSVRRELHTSIVKELLGE